MSNIELGCNGHFAPEGMGTGGNSWSTLQGADLRERAEGAAHEAI